MKVADWGAAVAAIAALLGWFQSVSRHEPRIAELEKDLANLAEKVDGFAPKSDVKEDIEAIAQQISRLNDRLCEMDNRRDAARSEITGFREGVVRELGELRAILTVIKNKEE